MIYIIRCTYHDLIVSKIYHCCIFWQPSKKWAVVSNTLLLSQLMRDTIHEWIELNTRFVSSIHGCIIASWIMRRANEEFASAGQKLFGRWPLQPTQRGRRKASPRTLAAQSFSTEVLKLHPAIAQHRITEEAFFDFHPAPNRNQESNVIDSCTILHQEEVLCHFRGGRKTCFWNASQLVSRTFFHQQLVAEKGFNWKLLPLVIF